LRAIQTPYDASKWRGIPNRLIGILWVEWGDL